MYKENFWVKVGPVSDDKILIPSSYKIVWPSSLIHYKNDLPEKNEKSIKKKHVNAFVDLCKH